MDLITEALKVSEVLDVEITAFHYCRYDSDCKTDAQVAKTTDPKFMQPHKAGAYIAIKPGCPDKLIAMVDLLDGLVFKVGDDEELAGWVKAMLATAASTTVVTPLIGIPSKLLKNAGVPLAKLVAYVLTVAKKAVSEACTAPFTSSSPMGTVVELSRRACLYCAMTVHAHVPRLLHTSNPRLLQILASTPALLAA